MSQRTKLDELFADIPRNRRKNFINRALRLMDKAVKSAEFSDSPREQSAVSIEALRAFQIVADLQIKAAQNEETAIRIMKAMHEMKQAETGEEKQRVVIEIVGPEEKAPSE